jgi:hypothetical protein
MHPAAFAGMAYGDYVELLDGAEQDVRVIRDALEAFGASVPRGLAAKANRLLKSMSRYKVALACAQPAGPTAVCRCGEPLSVVTRDRARETWGAFCLSCRVQATVAATGEVVRYDLVPGQEPRGAFALLSAYPCDLGEIARETKDMERTR